MNNQEIKQIKKFINCYKEIEESIEFMQKSIQDLSKKRNILLEELKNLQINEVSFMNSLIDKYGASEVTTFKILQLIAEDNNYNNY